MTEYENMIEWTLRKDGTWSYDYKVFGRWVEMMKGLGIDEMINCYSMVPWNCELEYMDESKGEKSYCGGRAWHRAFC